MSDIFLSYTAEDKDKAAKLAAAFEAQGLTAWLDLVDSVTRPFAVRNEELDLAKVFVVLWSKEARESSVVLGVLNFASQRKPVIAVLLDGFKLPSRFSPNEIFDFSDWYRSVVTQKLMRGMPVLLERIRVLAGKPERQPERFTAPASTPRPMGGNEPPTQKEHATQRREEDKRFDGVFISYRRGEAAAYAGRLYDRVAARFGKERVFIDTENVGWGEDFVDAITEAAESCAVMIALISPRWSRGAGGQEEVDDYVRLEVAKALGRKIRVIPILIQGASMPAPKELPEDLAPLVRRNALALSDTRWERDVEDLMKTLEGLLKG